MGYITPAAQAFYDRTIASTSQCAGGGMYADKSGYHNSRAANQARWPGNYSYRHPLDQRGPADKSAAYDFTFRDAQSGDYKTISVHCARLYQAGKAGDVRLMGWAEFYGQIDSDGTVEGCNFRTKADASSDISHRWHAHASESRELVEETINKIAFESVWHGETLAALLERIGFPAYGGVNLVLGTRSFSTYLWQRAAGIPADGDFGPATEAKVRAVQAAAGVTVDGVIGPQTWELVRSGAPTPPSTPPVVTPPPAPKPPAKPSYWIDEDGELGPATIRRWQGYMGTPVDGVLSKPKSSLVKRVQEYLNQKIRAGLKTDGDLGPNTVKALQRYLGTPQDGAISKPKSQMVLALQRRLNNSSF